MWGEIKNYVKWKNNSRNLECIHIDCTAFAKLDRQFKFELFKDWTLLQNIHYMFIWAYQIKTIIMNFHGKFLFVIIIFFFLLIDDTIWFTLKFCKYVIKIWIILHYASFIFRSQQLNKLILEIWKKKNISLFSKLSNIVFTTHKNIRRKRKKSFSERNGDRNQSLV